MRIVAGLATLRANLKTPCGGPWTQEAGKSPMSSCEFQHTSLAFWRARSPTHAQVPGTPASAQLWVHGRLRGVTRGLPRDAPRRGHDRARSREARAAFSFGLTCERVCGTNGSCSRSCPAWAAFKVSRTPSIRRRARGSSSGMASRALGSRSAARWVNEPRKIRLSDGHSEGPDRHGRTPQ